MDARALVAGIGSIEIRPIRPEDEALEEFFRHVSANDLRMRFTPAKRLSHAHLTRLTQIDYAREIAFVAFGETGALLGVAPSPTRTTRVPNTA